MAPFAERLNAAAILHFKRFFYAQARIWKFAVSQHAGRAASREKIFPTRFQIKM